jgi:hypothetical protein
VEGQKATCIPEEGRDQVDSVSPQHKELSKETSPFSSSGGCGVEG